MIRDMDNSRKSAGPKYKIEQWPAVALDSQLATSYARKLSPKS